MKINFKSIAFVTFLFFFQICAVWANDVSDIYSKAYDGIEKNISYYKKNSSFHVSEKPISKESSHFEMGFRKRVLAYSEQYAVEFIVKGKTSVVSTVQIFEKMDDVSLSQYIGETKENIKALFPLEKKNDKGVAIIYDSNPEVIITFFGKEETVESVWITAKLDKYRK